MLIWIAAVSLLPVSPRGAHAQDAPSTPEALVEAWVGLWGSYDLNVVSNLFLQDDRLTYFSSETEGQIQGFDRIVEHHRGFGFVPGGAPHDNTLWVGDVNIQEFDGSVLIGAIWYFGDPDSPDEAQRGPMSLLALRASDGYRIAHMHFATYSDTP